MGQLLAAPHAHAGAVVAVELRRPLARPAQHHNDPFAGPAEVVERIGRLRGPPAGVGKLPLTPGGQWIGVRLVTVRRAQVARVVAQDAIALRAAAEHGVDCLDVLDYRRVSRARVLEIHRPLDCREIVILDANAAHPEAGARLGPNGSPFRAVLVELSRGPLALPVLKQFGGGFAAIDKGKRRLHPLKLRRRPPARLGQLRRAHSGGPGVGRENKQQANNQRRPQGFHDLHGDAGFTLQGNAVR